MWLHHAFNNNKSLSGWRLRIDSISTMQREKSSILCNNLDRFEDFVNQ
ncbi:149_t:CDS:2 [Rhizophagus irregularis]|nr:149_t:CDS:2 [Rhizophagus irregularis]